MKLSLTKRQMDIRKKNINDMYYVKGLSIRQIQRVFEYKSPKSVFVILFPERAREYRKKTELKKLST